MLFAYSWIPWVFHSAYQVRDGKRWAFFFLSLGLSMQLASGYPLFSYLTFLALGLDWATRRMGERRRAGSGWIRSGMNFAAAALLAILYNAAWIIPFGEFAPFSNLSARTEFSSSLGWTDLVTWVNPFFKGHPLHSYPETPFSVTVFFTGLPTLVVLLWGAWKGKLKWPSNAFFLLVLGLSLGETAGLGGWLKNIIPFYGLVVRSGYWIPFVVWGAARLFLEAGDEAGKE